MKKTPKIEHHSITFGAHTIDFELEYKNRKTLEIGVEPDTRVTVKAPKNQPLDKIKEKVKKRAPWILKQKSFFEKLLPHTPPRQYVGGETHRYRGRQYRLKIAPNEEESVKLKGPYIWVHTPNRHNSDRVRELLEDWYRSHAKKVFPEKFEWALGLLSRCDVSLPKEPTLQIRKMKKRWGSCTLGGKILLNPDLIKAPSCGLEYVLVHELCHLKVPGHNRRFYRLLERVMPDWEERKERLERAMA